MKLLIIKTSSMGDVIHTFPAVMDALQAIPELTIDWVVEEHLAYLPQWHPAINTIIPVALRRWRKQKFNRMARQEIKIFLQQIRSQRYDAIIDAQGLMKSALWSRLAKGISHGYSRTSAREGMASLLYNKRYVISPQQQAVSKIRALFSAALNYPLPSSRPQYGFDPAVVANPINDQGYVLLFHGTTWETKHWPENYWRELIAKLEAKGERILIGWGGAKEKARAERLAVGFTQTALIPDLTIQGVAGVINDAKLVVAVDTGFAHLAEALDIPMVSLYGPTDPERMGPMGVNQRGLAADFPCAPCFKRQCSYSGPSAIQPACFNSLAPEAVLCAIESLPAMA